MAPGSLPRLALLALSGCAFLLDFPEESAGGGAGAGHTAGGGGVQPTGGGGASGGGGVDPTGGAPLGGGGASCALDPAQKSYSFDWAAPLGTASVDGSHPMVVALEADGDAWIGGRIEGGSLSAGGNPVTSTMGTNSGVFLLEIDPDGGAKRGFVFDASGAAWLHDLRFLSDGRLALVGGFYGDLDLGTATLTSTAPFDADYFNQLDGWLAILDPTSGAITDAARFGDDRYQELTGVGAGPDGGVAVTALITGTIDFGKGPKPNQGVVVAVLDSALDEVWSRALGTGTTSVYPRVAVAADGSVVVVGASTEANVFGGVDTAEVVMGGADAFVARYAADGTWLWHRLFGDVWDQQASQVALDEDGGVYVVGRYVWGLLEHGTGPGLSTGVSDYASDDGFAVKLALSDGATAWLRGITGQGYQEPNGVAVDCAGRVTVVGTVHTPPMQGVDFGDGDPVLATFDDAYGDFFLATYAGADGALLAKTRRGDEYEEIAYRALIDGAGRLLVTGSFFFSFSVDPGVGGSLSSPGWDFFLTRFSEGP